MKRRKFLKQFGSGIAAVTAFPVIVPRHVFGANDRITMGCIGLGGMGNSNMDAFLTKPEVRIVAVCDVDADHLMRAKEKVDRTYGNTDCVPYGDYQRILEDPGIDTVSIATPDHWHGIMGVAAARAGKDIYAEKPLAYSIAEGRAIVDAVRRHGAIWQTGSWQRSQRNFRFACELVRNGRIGTVHTVRVGLPFGNGINGSSLKITDPPPGFDYEKWLGPAPWRPYSPARCHWNFRWISDYSGGQLTDWAGHHCDIANWGMDTENRAPRFIEGQADFPPAEDGLFDTPPRYYFECDYEDGLKMIVADRSQQPKGMGTHFIGDEGWVHVSRSGIEAYPKTLLESVIKPGEIRLYRSEDHHQNFLDCVRSRKPTITPVDVAFQAILIAHLGNIAMKLGRRIEWDQNSETFPGDEMANRHLMRPMRSPYSL